MHKRLVLVVVAAVSVLAAGGGVLLGAATTVPATATFDDANSNRIRSDDSPTFSANFPYPSYQDGIDCVRSQVGGNGFSFRSRSYACTTATPSFAIRSVTLDFSQPVTGTCPNPSVVYDLFASGTLEERKLDICRSNLVPDVRIIASKMFANSALAYGTPVMLVFSTPTNFTGPGGFELDFEQNVRVTGSGTTRQMTASATAIAELYQNIPNSGRKVSLGRYYMPFSLTVAKF